MDPDEGIGSSGEKTGAAPAEHRDIVVIGASAGGVEALQRLVANLPTFLRASVFVVLHTPEEGRSTLPAILNRAGTLPAAHAADAEHIRPGRIYVAPPGRHLLISRGRVHLSSGPKENGHRPAIDPLFRSAAKAFGSRVIAVLLSGSLDDGTAGFQVVKQAGGQTLVQDPEEALYRGIIDSAIAGAPVDAILPVARLAAEIERRVGGEPAAELSPKGGAAADSLADRSGDPTSSSPSVDAEGTANGTPSGLVCPECSGVLWDVSEGNLLRFRCRVGHAYNGQTLASQQSRAVEAALWTATRMLEERAVLLGTMAGRLRANAQHRSADHFASRADEALRQAGSIRTILIEEQPAEALEVPASERDDDGPTGTDAS
jgi:two-component system chemotaxis response regulator CheB